MVQYNSQMIADLDDAMVLETTQMPFRIVDGGADTAISRACDHNGANCVEGAWFRYSATAYFGSVVGDCRFFSDENTTILGQYMVCNGRHDGSANGLFGDRSRHLEIKTFNAGADSRFYSERVFAR